jgi:hypothetical protein
MSIVDIVSELTDEIMADQKPRICWLCERVELEEPFNVCDSCMNRKDLWAEAIYTVTD